jgi:hypothetical protein
MYAPFSKFEKSRIFLYFILETSPALHMVSWAQLATCIQAQASAISFYVPQIRGSAWYDTGSAA